LLASEEVKADAGLTDFVRDRPEGRGVVSFDGDERSFTPVDRLRVVAVLASAVRGLVVPAVRSVMVPVVRMVTGLVEGEGLIREAGAVGFRFSVMAEPVVRFGSRCSDAVFLSVGSSVIFSVSISCSHSCGGRGVLFDLGVRGGRAVYELANASAELGIVGKRLCECVGPHRYRSRIQIR